jgi:Helix-turn-helix domain
MLQSARMNIESTSPAPPNKANTTDSQTRRGRKRGTRAPGITTDNSELAAISSKYERRFESEQELKAFIDEKELLRRLPVSRRTIHNWRRQGKIPSIVIGRRVLFCWENVADALRRMEHGGKQ